MAYDYPDFLSTGQPSNTLVGFLDQVVTSNTPVGTVDLTQFCEVVIFFNNKDAAAIFELQVGLFTGIPDPTPTVQNSPVVGPGQSGSIRVPAIRMQLGIIVVPHGPAATQHLQVSMYGVVNHVNMYDLYYGKHQIFAQSFALAANGNNTIPLAQWYAGPVEVCALGDSAGPCLIAFYYYEAANNTYIEFAQFGVTGQNVSGVTRLTFPPNPVEFRVFNGSTAQTVEVYIAPSVLNGI